MSLRLCACLCVCISRRLCEVVFLWAVCLCVCVNVRVCTEVPLPRDTKRKGPRRWSQDGGWSQGGGWGLGGTRGGPQGVKTRSVGRKCGSREGICFSRLRSSPTSLMTPNKCQTAGSRLDPHPRRGQAGVKWAHPAKTEVPTAPSAAAGRRLKRSERRTCQEAPGVSVISQGPLAAQATLAGRMTGALGWGVGGACLSGC